MLTNREIGAAKFTDKPYKLFDQGGLYVWITPTAKLWRYKYRVAGKEKTLSLGQYPELGLAEARDQHALARKQVKDGIDPSAEKRKARQRAILGAENTVKTIANSWFSKIAPNRGYAWSARMRYNIDEHVVPAFGKRPIDAITAADVLALTLRVSQNYPNAARFLQQMIARIFAFAVLHQKTKYNPVRELVGTITVPSTVNHKALDPNDLTEFLSTLDKYGGRPSTPLAARALLLTAVRKGELIGALWSEMDANNGVWTIPASRMKTKREHVVPLSLQAIEVFEQLRTLAFGSPFVLPNMFNPARHMSHSTLNAAFRRRAIIAAPHGMRSCFSTWANEHGHRPDVIETCLAHAERNTVRGAYNRAMYWPERRLLMQAWGDFVAGINTKSNVTSIEDRRKRA